MLEGLISPLLVKVKHFGGLYGGLADFGTGKGWSFAALIASLQVPSQVNRIWANARMGFFVSRHTVMHP